MRGKIIVCMLAFFSLLLLSCLTASAQQPNKNQIYIGSKSLNISYDSSAFSDDELSGYQIGYSRVFEKNFEFRGSFYSLEHDDDSDVTADGYDLGLVAGMVDLGFKLYGGIGYFSETWENSNSHDFSGWELKGGLGYNWSKVGLDFEVDIRDPSDYENYVNAVYGTNTDAAAASASLNLGIRF